MNNPNPFVPQGSLLEQHKRRTRMKLAVFCVLALSVASLTTMLIEGCKREENPPVDTNTDLSTPDTNSAPLEASNPPVVVPPIDTNQTSAVTQPLPPAPVVTPAPVEGSTYVVVKGDTLGKIARAHGVSLKDLEAANPNIQPTRLKIGMSVTLPASSGMEAAPTGTSDATDMGGEEIYVVRSGDTLHKIAHSHGTTVKALENENNLSTTKIKVGQKLKIPASAETTSAPVSAPPVSTPAPMPAPAAPAAPAPSAPAPASNTQ